MNTLPLDGRSRGQKINEAIEFLREQGYLVRGPLVGEANIKGVPDLVRFFYDTMAYHNPGHTIGFYGSRKRDALLARKFIESRVATGIGKKRALLECCGLIETLFKHQDKLNITVTSMSFLGQDKMAWVMECVIAVHNKLNKEVNQELDELWFDRFYKVQENEHKESDVVDAIKELDKILEYDDTKKK